MAAAGEFLSSGESNVKVIDGPIDSDHVYRIIASSTVPVLFKNMIEQWKAREWTVQCFCNKFSLLTTTFKVCPREEDHYLQIPIMENHCNYVEGNVGQFLEWLNGVSAKDSPLQKFPRLSTLFLLVFHCITVSSTPPFGMHLNRNRASRYISYCDSFCFPCFENYIALICFVFLTSGIRSLCT